MKALPPKGLLLCLLMVQFKGTAIGLWGMSECYLLASFQCMKRKLTFQVIFTLERLSKTGAVLSMKISVL